MARLMGVAVSSELWQHMATEGWSVSGDGRTLKCTDGLPEGAELVNSYYDGQRQTATLVFHHSSFNNVPVGGVIPILDIVHSMIEAGVE